MLLGGKRGRSFQGEFENYDRCAEDRSKRAKTDLDVPDVEGHPIKLTGEDLVARVWQHETDHLDGRLIIDRMSQSDEILNRRAIKQLRDHYSGQ